MLEILTPDYHPPANTVLDNAGGNNSDANDINTHYLWFVWRTSVHIRKLGSWGGPLVRMNRITSNSTVQQVGVGMEAKISQKNVANLFGKSLQVNKKKQKKAKRSAATLLTWFL